MDKNIFSKFDFDEFRKTAKFNQRLYEIGRKEEIKIIDNLRIYFDDPTIDFEPDGATADFRGNNLLIELKSRSCFSYTYKDTAIGVPKLVYAKNTKERFEFVFKFKDTTKRISYAELMQELTDNNLQLRRAPINGINHYFIPIKLLKDFTIIL